jgi:hypothetical protein
MIFKETRQCTAINVDFSTVHLHSFAVIVEPISAVLLKDNPRFQDITHFQHILQHGLLCILLSLSQVTRLRQSIQLRKLKLQAAAMYHM